MAIIECKECGNKISDEAKACPNCGVPRKPKKKTSKTTWTAFFIVVGVAWIGIFGGSEEVELIPHQVVDQSRFRDIKQTFDVVVHPVGNRLPTEKELGDIAEHLVKSAGRADIAFVSFYLPDQWADEENVGVFAYTKHDPGMTLTVSRFSLMDYPQYRDLASE